MSEMSTPPFPDGIGCDRCFQACPHAAAESRRGFRVLATLVDESHFGVCVEACPACAQRYLSIFCEMIDWADSDDPQCWSVFPLTTEEAARLMALGDAVDEATISGLDRDRRYLHVDHPKGAPAVTEWLPGGFWIRPHD